MVTPVIDGRIHTCADAEAGPEVLGGGRAAAAEFETQPPMAGPAPTLSASVGVDPSARPAAGSGLWVDRSAATGTVPANTRAMASAAGRRQWRRPLPALRRPRASSRTIDQARTKPNPPAISRQARIDVLSQH